MKNVIKAICVIIGTIVGAGFASGREVYLFFNTYGIYGMLGLLIASVLTGVVIYKVLIHIKIMKPDNYKDYLEKSNIDKNVKEIMNMIINIFLMISFYIMIAGFGAYFNQEYGLSSFIISAIVSVMCYITFMSHIEGVTKINTILMPFLMIMILLMGVKNNVFDMSEILVEENNFSNNGKWLVASLEYASYNGILLIPMLIELKKYTKNKEKSIAVIVSTIFFILAMVIYVILQKEGNYIGSIELPLIQAVKRFGTIYQYIYGIVIVSAIYTTAISAGYSFLENCSKDKKTYRYICLFLCISAPFISNLGFSYLVNLLYPVFGILGFIQVIYLIFDRRLEKKVKN